LVPQTASAVVPTALVEAAVPPAAKPKNAPSTKSKQQAPQAAADSKQSAAATAGENEARFVTDGITAALPPSFVAPRAAGGSLVAKSKTPFVTPGITPAPVPTPPAQQSAAAPHENKLRIATKGADKPAAQPDGDGAPDLVDKDSPAQQAVQAPDVMPLAKQPARRSPEVFAAIKRADLRVRHGFKLAERGALFAARAEFIAALKMIAQAYDAQEGSNQNSQGVAAGLAALKEAGDFVRLTDPLQSPSIAQIILPHATPALKDADTSGLTPMTAAQAYYSYAQERLSAATCQEMCGSMALYAMGKVTSLAAKSDGRQLESTGQAIALYRAALIAEPRNFRAANELGVLLAENGQLELARELLIQSVSVSPQATTWRNLAIVHSRSGQPNLAEHAKGQAIALQRGGGDPNVPAVQWVDPAAFASTAPAGDGMPPAVVTDKKDATATKSEGKTEKPTENVAKKSISDWLRLTPRR
jgi:tetratricopeptide (TPR) repeat protein